ncbi:MAG: hypothetical protein KJ072_04040 [Verrucomicrobia bacterium]|nr:hypothetical protein [Verrucomicrobiota bacterium]
MQPALRKPLRSPATTLSGLRLHRRLCGSFLLAVPLLVCTSNALAADSLANHAGAAAWSPVGADPAGRFQILLSGSHGDPSPLAGTVRIRMLPGIHLDAPPPQLGTEVTALWTGELLAPVAAEGWSYLGVALRAKTVAGSNLAERHVVWVEPDLILICDFLLPAEPATSRFLLRAADRFEWDAAREHHLLELPTAGATVRHLFPQPLEFSQRQDDAASGESQARPSWTLEGVTPKPEGALAMLTVLVPHEAGARRRMLAFKRLEGTLAIGARVHRDGYPTLVAFRKPGVTGPASLTGLDFTGPVAVHVSRPRKR